MEARKLILSALLGGPVLGVLMGFAAHPTMVMLPEPSWRQARPDPIFSEQSAPDNLDNLDPQPFMTAYDPEERMPTWKRRAMARASALSEAYYAEPPPLPPFDDEPEQPKSFAQIAPALVDQAAETRDAARDARAPAADDVQSAAVDPEPDPQPEPAIVG